MPKANGAATKTAPATPETVTVEPGPAKTVDSSDDWFSSLETDTEYTKALFYGKEGTGKTTAAAKAANMGRVLVVNAEGGLKKTALRNQGVAVENIAVWPRPDSGETVTAAGLVELHQRLLRDLTDDPASWYAVIIDSITEVANVVREQATDKRVAKARVELDPDFVDRDDYGVMTNQLRKAIRRFRDLPCHVVLIGLEKDDEDLKQFRPALSPALNTDVLGYVDLIGRFGSPDGTYRARFRGTERIRAKDRFGVLPDSLAEPGFDRIQMWLTGDLTTENDPLQQDLEAQDRERAAAAEKAKAEAEAAKAAKKRAPRKAAAKPAAEVETVAKEEDTPES